MTPLIGALLGAALGGGAFTAVLSWRGFPSRREETGLRRSSSLKRPTTLLGIRVALSVAGSAAAVGLTGWVVAGFFAGVASFMSPTVLGARAKRDREIEQMAALATWIEMMRDTVSAASGLTETLKATAVSAPPVIRTSVRQLASRAEREPLPDALAKFADEMDHAVADSVAVTLRLAAAHQVGSLQESLADIAESTRQEVSMRLRIEASRARQFTSARFVAGIVAVFSVGMVGFNRTYLAPFDTFSGQLALSLIGGLFIASGVALVKMSQFSSPLRVLNVREVPAGTSAGGGLQP